MRDNEIYRVYTELEDVEGNEHVSMNIVFPVDALKNKHGVAKIHDMWFDIINEIDDELKELKS